ncbi:putative reverse transcriptase domain-containing protein [Tanacetum coccineum]
MPPKRTSTSETPAITLAAIRQLINDGISSALKAQAASMVSASNPNKNIGTSGTPVAREGINNNKRKFEDRGNTTNNNNYPKHNNNNHSNICKNNNYQDNNNKTTITMITTNSSIEDKKLLGLILNCRSKGPTTGSNLLSVSVTCHACGEKGHYKSQCSSKTDNGTSHVSKKSLCDKFLIIPKKEIWLDDKLNYMEESVEIMD